MTLVEKGGPIYQLNVARSSHRGRVQGWLLGDFMALSWGVSRGLVGSNGGFMIFMGIESDLERWDCGELERLAQDGSVPIS